jgi:hypothetical protein
MKTLLLTSLLLASFLSSSALGRTALALTSQICDATSDRILAEEILNHLAVGADEGLSSRCVVRPRFIRFESMEQDVYQRRVNSISAKVTAVEPMIINGKHRNITVVRYEIMKENGDVLKGDFSFSRTQGEEWIQQSGCAYINGEPSTPFILSNCASGK